MPLLRRLAIALGGVLLALLCLAVAVTRATGGAVVTPIDVRRDPATTLNAKAGPGASGLPSPVERWRASFPFEFVGRPAADEAGVVATVGETEVVALGLDGSSRWTTPVVGALVAAPRIDGDLVFVAAKRAVLALRRSDGSVAWSVPTAADGEDDERASRPVVVGDVVIAATENGYVFGLDRVTGGPRWSTQLATGIASDPAAATGAAVVVGIGQWWGIDPATGTTLWSGDLGLFGTSSPVVYRDGDHWVAAVASDEHALAVDARTGEPLWRSPADQSELFQVPLVTESELLVPDHWGRLAAFDPHGGRELWRTNGPDGVAEWGEPVPLGRRVVALALDEGGPRISSPHESVAVRPPSIGHGLAGLPDGGIVVSTWTGPTNYLVAYDLSPPSRYP